LVNHIKSEKHIQCCSDNVEFTPYPIAAEDILEIWKARVKLTSHLDVPNPGFSTTVISEQLQAQHKMLEHLHQHLTAVKVN
jgi:hypothetical protein